MKLTKEDSTILKGYSIIIIVLHNLLHNIQPYPSQNEFSFNKQKPLYLLDIATHDPGDLVRAIITFYGHYGVKVFIFLSAYGLTKTYFIKSIAGKEYLTRIFRLYKSFLFVLIVWLTYSLVTNRESFFEFIEINSLPVIFKVLAINLPGYALAPVGPWWFFPTIIQLYCLFPIFLILFEKHGKWFLALLSLFALIISWEVEKKIIYLNAIGHIPEFCLGIYFGSLRSFRVSTKTSCFALLIFTVSHTQRWAWSLSGSAIIILVLLLYGKSKDTHQQPSSLSKIVKTLGGLSLFIFLIHGSIRPPFILLIQKINNDFATLIIGGVFLAAVTVFSMIAKKLFNTLDKKRVHLF